MLHAHGVRVISTIGMASFQQIEQVKDFVAEITGVKQERLTEATRLGHDLGVDGEDAAELIQAFVQRFQVDMSEFNFDSHFGPEAGFNPITYLIGRVFRRHEIETVPVTIADLAEAATTGKWESQQHYTC